MKPTSTRILLAGFGLALALLGGVAWFGWRHAGRTQQAAEWVAHTHKMQANRNLLLSLVLDIELGQRGYVLTGQPVFLEGFEGAVNRVIQQERRLEELTHDEEQKANLSALKPLIAERIDFARRTMELRKNSGIEAAGQEIATLKGKQLTDEIRARFALMDARTEVLLHERSAAARREARSARVMTIAGTGLSVTLLIAVFALVLRENRLRQRAQDQLDRFFTLSLDLLCIASADGYFKHVNPAFARTLGWSVEEILARPFLDFVHPDDHAATLREVERQVVAGEPVLQFENRYRHQDGSWRVLSWKSVPGPGGLLYAAARDVTERNQAEEAIKRLNSELGRRAAQLEGANKELEAFSYSVSHDLRAPLRHIDGYANLLTDAASDKLDETARRYLGVIADASKRMGQLIDDLLAFSRSGRQEMRLAECDLDALLRQVLRDLQGETAGREVNIITRALPRVPADPALLRQVLANLVGNALKYTRKRPQALIEIGLTQETDAEWVFGVRDNGAGFDPQYAHKLFGVFQRLHSARDFEGTGVGLANVRRIIARHGGRTWAEGAVDQGAAFYFSLPKQAPRPAAEAAPETAELPRQEAA
jgi:PAS domain S-box-containing protein